MSAPRTKGRAFFGSIAAAIPLVAAAAFAAGVGPAGVTTAELPSARTVSTQREVSCPGAIAGNSDAAATNTDAQFHVEGPSTGLQMRATAIEPKSGLLYGNTTVSQAQLTATGEIKTPTIKIRTGSGTETTAQATPGSADFSTFGSPSINDPDMVIGTSFDHVEPVLEAGVSALTDHGDYRSLALARCESPAVEATFTGVSTMPGSSSALTLVNPSTRAATARITVFTPDGIATFSAANSITLGAGETKSVLVESLAPGKNVVSVHVEVQGSALGMHMDSTQRDGLTPRGADFIPSVSASKDALYPGVMVRSANLGPLVSLANPSGTQTRVTLSAISSTGEKTDLGEHVVNAGSTVQVPVEQLPVGTFALSVSAPVPVYSSVSARAEGPDLPGDTVGAAQDFATYSPAQELVRASLVSLPQQGSGGTLTLYSPEQSTVVIQGILANGTLAPEVTQKITASQPVSVEASQIAGVGQEGQLVGFIVVPESSHSLYGQWNQSVAATDTGALIAALPLTNSNAETIHVEVRVNP